jgi:hypothetical protein
MLGLFVVLAVLDGRLRKTGGPGIVGFELAGTLERSRDMVATWGLEGQRAARLSLLLDYPYLVAYATFLALAAAAIRDRARRRGWQRLASAGRVIVFFPVAAAACDAIENVGLLLALAERGGAAAPGIATAFASVKFLLTTIAILYILIGLARGASDRAVKPAP